MKYPAQERQNRGYGIRYTRWLMDSGVANEIGQDAVVVLTAVITVEDALHYKRPPTFYNEQMMRRCGFRSKHTLIGARKRAIDHGLLCYSPGKKRQPGTYFTIGLDPDDEIFGAYPAPKADGNEIFGASYDTKSGPKADPTKPIPNTQEEEAASGESPSASKSGKAKPSGFDPSNVELPPPLRTDRFREAWREWITHRREIRKKLTPTATAKQIKQLADWGEDRAVAAIEHTVAMGWTGLREPDSATTRNGSPPPPPKKAQPLRTWEDIGE